MAALTNEAFMELVRQYPILYDRFSKDFKDKNKKNNAWNKVAEIAGITIEECEKKYKNIRTNYVRSKKKRPSGSGRVSEDADDSHSFQWLDTFIEHRQTYTNLPSCSSRSTSPSEQISDTESSEVALDLSNGQDERDSDCVEDVASFSGSLSPAAMASSCVEKPEEGLKRSRCEEKGKGIATANNRPWARGSKKVRKSDVDNAFLKTLNSFEKSVCSHVGALNQKPEDDEDVLFCKSIVGQIKRLPQERKGLAKCQILQMLQSFEFGMSSGPAVNVPLSSVNVPFSQQEAGQQFLLPIHQSASREFATYQKL